MKRCPECNARCFDDMDTCYECMHSFTDDFGEDFDFSGSELALSEAQHAETIGRVPIEKEKNGWVFVPEESVSRLLQSPPEYEGPIPEPFVLLNESSQEDQAPQGRQFIVRGAETLSVADLARLSENSQVRMEVPLFCSCGDKEWTLKMEIPMKVTRVHEDARG